MVQTTLTLNFFSMPCVVSSGGGQFFVRLFPDFGGGFFVEQFRDAEITLQFQMRPVIERIAERVRHGGGPGLELVEGIGIARAKTFRDAVGPHGAPFVVIAFEPDFKQIFELAVRRDVARRNVAVVIENRLGLGVFVVKLAGRLGAQQKIFVDEWHKTGRLAEQRFHVPLEQIFGDVFGDDRFMLLERVEITVAFLRGDFETDVDQLPEA